MKRILFLLCAIIGHSQIQAQPLTIKDTLVLAKQYTSGLLAIKNPGKSLELYTYCANKGDSSAMNAVGIIYQNGIAGVKPDRNKAMEWFTKAANAGYARGWYNIALLYKEIRDYTTAYSYLSKGAALQDEPSIYYQGYMQYKGFGCQQDYTAAAKKFARGAALNRPNSMYFYGLCLRNGYGVTANADSANYWLTRASNRGYSMAKDELVMKEPENTTVGGELAKKIMAAQSAMPKTKTVNKYHKIENRVDVNEVAGTYTGYLLKYDWSGQHTIEANKLTVTLEYDKDSLTGIWKEDDSLMVPLHAKLNPKALVFRQMRYSKKNHYSPTLPELAILKQANLQLDKIGDSVYLSGNIEQFIPSRNEPSKPLYIALIRTIASNKEILVKETPLRAYPNPFGSNITIDFELKETCKVTTQLLTMDGKVVYTNPAGTLTAGSYTLPIQTQQIAAGYYTLALRYGNKLRTTKVIKL